MKSLIVALIIVIPFAGMGQKIQSVIANTRFIVFPDSIRRGQIKFIRTKADTIPFVGKKELLANLSFNDYWYYKNANDSSVYNSKGLLIENYRYSNSSNKLTYKDEGTYDASDNIIRQISVDGNGNIVTNATYQYDSLNNCIENTFYSKFTNKTVEQTEEIKQIDNGISEYVYTTDSAGKKKLMNITDTEIEKNKKTVCIYNAEGNITSKMEKEINGNTTHGIDRWFATNGKVTWENKTTTTRKKNKKIFESIVGNKTYYEEMELNDYGDAIKEHIKRYTNEKDIANYVITYTYEYDSKGNYTKKIIYLENKPILEINRVIGYYD